ncbi:MAG: hypothetical protein DRP22_02250, partial [Verrucomicrobia bacterium]
MQFPRSAAIWLALVVSLFFRIPGAAASAVEADLRYYGVYRSARTGWAPVPAAVSPELVPGVDVVIYRVGAVSAFDMILSPGVDVNGLSLSLPGWRLLHVTAGSAVWMREGRLLVCRAPIAYQIRGRSVVRLAAGFRRCGEGIGFWVIGHDPDYPLVIDPEILNLSYAGDAQHDEFNAVAVGPDGSTYMAGETVVSGTVDALVVKVSPSGTNIEYMTIISGGSNDV